MSNVDKLRGMLAAATDRPWTLGTTWVRSPGGYVVLHFTPTCAADDIAVMVAAVNALPALLAVYEAAVVVRERMLSIKVSIDRDDRAACDVLYAAVDAARGAK